MSTLVAIPVFNEEQTVVSVLKEVRRYHAGDVLLIDDGSTDASVELVRELNDPAIKVIAHPENLGYGASLQEMFRHALHVHYQFLITIDCDAQHEPCMIPKFVETIGKEKVDVCSGSRYLSDLKQDTEAPPDRRAINFEITERINHITGYQLTDTFCGFKAYRVEALSNLNLTVSGYGFPVQFWLQAWKNNLSIMEIPVARIYLNYARTFGNGLDNPDMRRGYYHEIIESELAG